MYLCCCTDDHISFNAARLLYSLLNETSGRFGSRVRSSGDAASHHIAVRLLLCRRPWFVDPPPPPLLSFHCNRAQCYIIPHSLNKGRANRSIIIWPINKSRQQWHLFFSFYYINILCISPSWYAGRARWSVWSVPGTHTTTISDCISYRIVKRHTLHWYKEKKRKKRRMKCYIQ